MDRRVVVMSAAGALVGAVVGGVIGAVFAGGDATIVGVGTLATAAASCVLALVTWQYVRFTGEYVELTRQLVSTQERSHRSAARHDALTRVNAGLAGGNTARLSLFRKALATALAADAPNWSDVDARRATAEQLFFLLTTESSVIGGALGTAMFSLGYRLNDLVLASLLVEGAQQGIADDGGWDAVSLAFEADPDRDPGGPSLHELRAGSYAEQITSDVGLLGAAVRHALAGEDDNATEVAKAICPQVSPGDDGAAVG